MAFVVSKLFMLVSISSIIGVVLIVVEHMLFLLPFNSFMGQLNCSESVVTLLYSVLFCFPRSGFLL
jgi:hypothetical protein